jgi:quinolinate synthase
MSNQLIEQIKSVKAKKRATILAHYYENGDIQDIADYVGDSYFLAQKGQASESPLILLAGVVFMAESVKLLNPTKKVVVPTLEAGCSLVSESPYDQYLKWRLEHPKALAVTYINSSAAVKSISDVIVTSSNAAKILASIPGDRQILFGPDQNLGRYLSKKLERPMILWPGACEVHVLFSSKKLYSLTQEHPDAIVIAHPECDQAVLQYAHVIGSTSHLLEVVQNNPAKKFIVATETGILHQMRKARPEVELIQAPVEGSCGCNDCPFMKLNTLENLLFALENEAPEVNIPRGLLSTASLSLKRMMAISNGETISWPDSFMPPNDQDHN